MIDEPLALLAEAFGSPEPEAPSVAGHEPTMMGTLRTVAEADAIIAAASVAGSDASRPSVWFV